MQIIYSFSIFVLALVGTANAADPVISSATRSGGVVTVTGSNFGAKSPAAPLLWDNFNNGVHTDPLTEHSDWLEKSGGGYYSNVSKMGSTGLSANRTLIPTSHANSSYYDLVTGYTELYYSYMLRYDGTLSGGIYKNGRITTSVNVGTTGYDSNGMVAISDNYCLFRPDASSVYIGSTAGADPVEDNGQTFDTVNIKSSNWQRHQMYIKASIPAGTANGRVFARVHTETKTLNDYVTRATGQVFEYDKVLLGIMVTDASSGTTEVYTDDIYVDNTLARVELCTASTWDSGASCNPQIPTVWGGTITATENLGNNSEETSLYAYVVNVDGEVNTSGVLVTNSAAQSGHQASSTGSFY